MATAVPLPIAGSPNKPGTRRRRNNDAGCRGGDINIDTDGGLSRYGMQAHQHACGQSERGGQRGPTGWNVY
jgi:hypothetical protein